MISVRVETIDRFSRTRKFKTLAGARRFAHKHVGETPDISWNFGYAVSADGIGKIVTWGDSDGKPVTIFDLFPKAEKALTKDDVAAWS